MADYGSGPGWNETQWQTVNNAIAEEFSKASVAAELLRPYGPLASSAEAVRKELLKEVTVDANKTAVSVEDDRTLQLLTLPILVQLSNQQVADETLSTALLAFRRAANMLALELDEIVFKGRKQGAAGRVTNDPDNLDGLIAAPKISVAKSGGGARATSTGENLVSAVASAIGELEKSKHTRPFACVLGHEFFAEAHKPSAGIVPADRIEKLLAGSSGEKGLLLKSSRLDENSGIVVSLAAGAIDLVIATPPKAQFLQMTTDAKALFRVYTRFTLRIKDEDIDDRPIRVLKPR
jgi:uncharacterized linocin/CFP29 family protein